MGRSLVASEAGIKRAKVALKRQNLTQTALATEFALASWTTVSRFFNGKPVDRNIFTEICHRLDLDWQDIAAPFLADEEEEQRRESGEISPELAAVQANSQKARTALNPYILPPIRRETLLQKCLTAIRRGVTENKRRVVPLLGAAGYGKSTILGSIYDELVQAETGWVALVRCNDFIETAETFTTELGEKVSGVRQSIVEITSRLTSQHGRGILLIDTLDLVLEKKLVPVLRGMLSQLLDNGTTVVFTCRDADYRDFFEPYHESFAGFTESIERCQIPLFDQVEVKEAAYAFCQQELKQTQDASINFANKIVSLSADSKSLADITCNPLLLALLCKLFGEDGNVPEDLTVSQLYQLYWDYRIPKSLKQRPDSHRIGMAKKKLCLTLAEMMYNASDERLRDFVYENQLALDDTEVLAYKELLSDGVLQDLGAERVSFFHQTFLEFAIARYFVSTPNGENQKREILNTIAMATGRDSPNPTQENQKREILNTIAPSQNTNSKYFIWSIVRQLLNLVNFEEFHHISNIVNINELYPFRVVAFASVSRTESDSANVLLQLLTTALAQGDAYQDILLVVASGVPNRHVETVWLVVLELLRETKQTLINKAAEIAGELLARIPSHNHTNPMEQALSAVDNRDITENANDIATKAFGTLISTYSKTVQQLGREIDVNVLNPLKKRYFSFGGNARSHVLQLLNTPGVPASLQLEIFTLIINEPLTEIAKEKENAVKLLQNLLPSLILAGNTPLGKSWLEALHAPLPKGWDVVQAGAIAHHAVNEPELMATLINGLFPEQYSKDDTQRVRRLHITVTEAMKNGASDSVAAVLLAKPIENVPKNQISTVSLILRELAKYAVTNTQKSPEFYISLAQWILPILTKYPNETILMLDVLTSADIQVEPLLSQALINTLPNVEQKQALTIIKALRNIPVALESYLKDNINFKEVRIALVRFYHHQAINTQSETAVKAIVEFCLDISREIALDASHVLIELSKELPLDVNDLIAVIARTKIVGVRNNCLQALTKMVEYGSEIGDADIVNVCTTLSNEKTPETLRLLYKLIECWVQKSNQISEALSTATFELTNRVINERSDDWLNATVAHPAFVTLKNIANLEYPHLNTQLGLCARSLLRHTDICTVNSTFVIGLLDKVANFDVDFLARVVHEDLVLEDGVLPVANLDAVVVAIFHNQGKHSPLLDEMLASERFPMQIKSQIIRERER